MKSIFRWVVFLLPVMALPALSGSAYAACEQDSAYIVNGFMKATVRVASDPAGRKEYPSSAFDTPQTVSACDLSAKGELPLQISDSAGTRKVFVRLRYLKTSRNKIDCFKPVLGKQMARDHSTPGASSECK